MLSDLTDGARVNLLAVLHMVSFMLNVKQEGCKYQFGLTRLGFKPKPTAPEHLPTRQSELFQEKLVSMLFFFLWNGVTFSKEELNTAFFLSNQMAKGMERLTLDL